MFFADGDDIVPPMQLNLTALEGRILGALVEKERTTPEYYPLTLNALVAADGVMIPLQTEFYAMEGLSQLLKTIEQVRARQNPRLDIEGVVLTMHDRRNRLSDLVAADVRAALGARVYDTMIPRNVRLSEAPSHGIPALLYDMRCPGSEAYMALAREMIGSAAKAA